MACVCSAVRYDRSARAKPATGSRYYFDGRRISEIFVWVIRKSDDYRYETRFFALHYYVYNSGAISVLS